MEWFVTVLPSLVPRTQALFSVSEFDYFSYLNSNGVMLHLSFYGWLVFHRIMSSGFLHVVIYDSIFYSPLPIIYLFGKQNYSSWGREKGNSLICWFTFHVAAMAGLGKAKAWSLEPPSGSPLWVAEAQAFGPSSCLFAFLGTLAGNS